MIGVVTDSSADLPVDIARHYRIEVVPLTVRFGSRDFMDHVGLTPESFWRELAVSEVLPETVAPGVGQFEEAFQTLHDQGASGIVAVCISSRLSAAYQAASIAAERVRPRVPVRVIDSNTVSMALGFQVLEAARAARQDESLEVVAEAARAAIPKTGLLATLDSLEFLRRGHRIGASQALVGGVLDVKPLLTINDGVLAPAGRVRTRARALEMLVSRVMRIADGIAELAVLHGQAEDLEALILRLARHVAREDVLVTALGPVVGTHTGPGVIGIAFRLK